MGGKCRIVGGEEIRELTGQDVGRIIYVDIKIKNNYKRGIGERQPSEKEGLFWGVMNAYNKQMEITDIVWGHEIQSWGI